MTSMKFCVQVPMAVASLLSAGAHAGITAVEWSTAAGGNGHWYMCHRFDNPVDWHVAKAEAESLGGYLATITSAAENMFVFDVSLAQNGWDSSTPSGPYLGASKQADGSFAWVTGEAFEYANWLPGEPSSGSWEPYLHMLGGPPGTTAPNPFWNDIDGTQITAMFEFNSQPVPGPAAISVMFAIGATPLRRRRH